MKCTKCGIELKKGVNPPSQHHVYPVRYFGSGRHNRMKVLFCNNCHRELEIIIHNFEEKIIAIIIAQQQLSRRPNKNKIKRIFRSMKQVYLQMVNDYVQS